MGSFGGGILRQLRGARHVALFASVVVLALIALALPIGVNGGFRTQRTELERRVEGILSQIDGIGKVGAMVNQAPDGTVTGAVIVVEHLRGVKDYLTLQSAVATLLDIEISRIRIVGNDGAFGGEA